MQPSDKLTIETPEQIALELPLAGIGSRFLALAFDTLLQFILYIVAGLAAIFLLPAIGIGRWIPASLGPALALLFFFCIYWGYFAFFEAIWKGQTPGKRSAGIRVIKENGRPINVFEAIGRNLMRAIDGLPGMYAVGIITMMLNAQNRRLGDYVAGTVVVHDKKMEEVKPDWVDTARDNSPEPQLREITPEELMLIETYLHRRYELDPVVRASTAAQIVSKVREKTGMEVTPGQSNDDFLESVARQVRDTARFR